MTAQKDIPSKIIGAKETQPAESSTETIVQAADDLDLSDNGQEKKDEEQDSSTHLPKAVRPRPVAQDADLKDPALYFNKELSWIDFNWRVLHLVMDERIPLLERVKFVAITASNLDEFTQKRIGGLKRQQAAGVRELSIDGRTPGEQLGLLREATSLMHKTMTATWEEVLRPALREEAGVDICDYDTLSSSQKAILYKHFKREIYPILTPLTVDPGHPFPFISNLSLSLAVILEHPQHGTTHFVRLKIPTKRWLHVSDNQTGEIHGARIRLLPVEQLIARHVDELFPGMIVVSVHPFRITRNADVSRDEEVADDLLAMISEELRERRFAPVVRLEVAAGMPAYERSVLLRELELSGSDVYDVQGLLDLTGCFQVASLNKPAYRYEPYEPAIPYALQHEGETKDTKDIFAIIRQGDLMVYHPYDSFGVSVQRLLEEAADDERVLAIKQTLYRTSDESPIMKALMRAGEKGKQVAVLVEVKARFDEANNIEWGRMLENSGVHVAYGLVGLKTHAKTTLIVRQDTEGIRTYCHIGTGNYNSQTARLYTDLGLMTADPVIGRDVINLFHTLTGFAPAQEFEKVLVAPTQMRVPFYKLIEREITNQEKYGNGRIIAKFNALDDRGIIRRLYEASQEGVQIDLILRGHTMLRPALPGYSDNIHIISIIGRFLEHDRIYYFCNNDDPQIFIGSADWRTRNLRTRVELITPIEDPNYKEQLVQLLDDALKDNFSAWDLDSEGQYTLRYPKKDEPVREFQTQQMRRAHKRAKKPRP
ncbi:MAG: polyphosphate kinase 1 [Candidatus Promineifilaceae bacterium]